MRRGGVLILLIGLILIVGAGALFLFLQQSGGGATGQGDGVDILPTEASQIEVVRAKVDIPQNTVISDTVTLLEYVVIDESEYDATQNFIDFGEVEGKLTTRAIRANQIVEQAALTDPGLSQQIPTAEADRPRDKAYPFIVNNLSGVADQVKPGDFVDVVSTFTVERRRSYPSAQRLEEQAGQTVPVVERELTDLQFNTTKTIVQQAQVIRIIRPPSAAEDGEPTPQPDTQSQDGGPPQVDASGQPIDPATGGDPSGLTQGLWTVILAVNDQEIELMEFAQSTNARSVLVLRGAGDSAFEPTVGATFDLLISEFGVPLPRPLPPRVLGEDEVFLPEVTPTPAPTRVP